MPTNAAAQNTLEVRVNNDNDDAEERSSNGAMYLDSSDLELANSPESEDTVGIRFNNITIPKGVTITNAYVQFTTDETDSGSISLTIRGHDTDNASGFTTSSANISSRSKTSASASWSPPAWNSVGEAGSNQRTSNLASIIQEIIDRSGWSSGNSLVLIFTGTGTRTAEAHDGSSGSAPLLHVEYTNGPPTTYYVRTDGDDGNTGLGSSSSEAWQTVRHATRFDDLEPGDIIYVRAGTYTERIQPDEDGASGLPIRVVADRTGSVSGWSAGEVNIVHDDEKVLELDGDDYWSFEGFRFQGKSDKETVKLKDSDGCVFSSCEIFDGKIGIRAEGTMDAVITNCLIYDHAEDGIFVKDGGCTLEIWNTTIVDNSSDGIEQDNGTVTIRNSIVAYNSSDGLDINSGTMNHTYNLVYGNGDQQFEGTSISTGEISQNPQFEDASSSDYRLQASSPGINAGTDASGTVDEDILGVVRPIGASWDMGCYEFPILGIWAFDEGSGGTVADDSGNGNDATLQGSTAWESARCGETVKLNGTSDWIDLGQIDLGTRSFTMAGWFRTTSTTQQTIFAATATGTSNHAFYVELDSDGHAQFVYRSPAASSGGTTLYSNDTYADGVWHYVAAVKSTTQLLLYVDGELVDVVSDTTSVHSSVDLVLGRHGKLLGQQYFNGSMDEVLLYGTAYSASEIAALTGVVGRWRLDATSGSFALDSTVLGNSGTLSSGFTFDASSVSPAPIDDGLEFDGSADYITVPNSASLQITDSLTISAWIKGDAWGSGSDADVIVRKGEGNPNNYQLAIGDGRLSFTLDGGDPGDFQGDTILSTDRWYHVAATWDGSEVRLYVDGVLDHASPFSKSAPIGTDTRDLYIGGRSGADLFDGVLDDVRLFNRALCAEEIESFGHGSQLRGVRIIKWIEIQ